MRKSLITVLFFFLYAVQINAYELQFELDATDENALPSALTKAVDDAFEMNKQGLASLDKKDYDAAMKYFNEALKILPDYSDAQNNRGVVYFRRGIISDAQKIWENLAAKDPGYALASYNLGLIYLNEKKMEAAGRLFERAIKADNKFVEAYVRLGLITLGMGSREKAIEYLRKAYKINPLNQDAWSFMVHGLIQTGDTTEAISILKKKTDNHEALKMLGRIEGVRKNYLKASEYFSKAVDKGADPSILVELASVKIDERKYSEALASLKIYFTKNIPHTADAWLLAGIASKECGDLEGAQKYFEEGSKAYSTDPILKYNLGQIYFHRKQYDQAENAWEGLSDSIQDPSLLYMRALNAKRRNDLVAAEKLINQAIVMDSRAEFFDFLGVIYHLKKDDKKAEEQFRKALKIDPELRSAQMNLALTATKPEELIILTKQLQQQFSTCSGDSCTELGFQLAVVYYHQKDIGKAIQTIVTMKEDDKDERIYRHLAIFYRENHEWDKAISCLENAAKRFVLEPQTEYEQAETYLLAGYHAKAVEYLTKLLPKWRQNPWRLHYQIGYSYLELNELEQARASFERSIKSKSDNVAARALLAFVLNRQGNVTEARKLWEKNVKDDPSNPAILINLGLSLERDGQFEGALEYYKKAEMLKSGDKELQLNIGNVYAGLERYTDALNAYNIALSSGKRELAAYNIFLVSRKKKDKEKGQKMVQLLNLEFSTSVYTKRAQAELDIWNGDTAKALQLLESLIEKDAGDNILLAGIYASKGNKEKVNIYLGKLPAEMQWEKAAKGIRAQLAFKEGDFQQSLSLFRESGDTSFATQYNIALAAYNAKQYSEALRIAERLVKNATGVDRADCCRLAGNAAFTLKEWNNARQWYFQLTNVEANNSIVQYNLAVAFYNLNDMESSWKYYKRAQTLDTSISNKDIEAKYKHSKGDVAGDSAVKLDSTDVWYNMAVDLQNDGKDTLAEQLYLKIVKKNSLHSQAWNNLGAIYGVRGDIDNAEKSYWKAIEKRHDIPETYANLVNLYIELEEFVKARQWIIKGIGHNPDSEILAGMREKISEAEKAAKAAKEDAGPQ